MKDAIKVDDSIVIQDLSCYNQICIWPHCTLGDHSINDFIDYMKDAYNIRVRFIEEVKIDDNRTDIAFHIHDDDISKFAIPRLATDIKWYEDAIDNGYCKGYPASFLEKYPRGW